MGIILTQLGGIQTVSSTIEREIRYSLQDLHSAYTEYYWNRVHSFWLCVAAVIVVAIGLMAPGLSYKIMASGAMLWLQIMLYNLVAIQLASRNLLRSPTFQLPQHIILDESGFSMNCEAAQTLINWSLFVSYYEGKTCFLLFTNPYAFRVIPKRCLEDHSPDLDKVRELLSTHIPPKSSPISSGMARHQRYINVDSVLFVIIIMIVAIVFGLRNR
jgi:hypothetical protein